MSHERRVRWNDGVFGPLRGQPQSDPSLHERSLSLLDAQFEIRGSKNGKNLTFLDRASEVYSDLGNPPGNFERERDLILCRQRAGDRYRAYERLLGYFDGSYRPWRRRPLGLGGGAPRSRTGRCAEGCQDEETGEAAAHSVLIVAQDAKCCKCLRIPSPP